MRTLTSQPWRPLGHIRFTGLVYEGELQLGKHGILGASLVAGEIHSNLDLSIVLERTLPPGDLKELLLSNKALHDALKLCPPCYSEGYLETSICTVGYTLRVTTGIQIKKLDVGLNLGLLIPTAPAADLYNPAAVPLGGNKHPGMYGEFRGGFLLKEDATH